MYTLPEKHVHVCKHTEYLFHNTKSVFCHTVKDQRDFTAVFFVLQWIIWHSLLTGFLLKAFLELEKLSLFAVEVCVFISCVHVCERSLSWQIQLSNRWYLGYSYLKKKGGGGKGDLMEVLIFRTQEIKKKKKIIAHPCHLCNLLPAIFVTSEV